MKSILIISTTYAQLQQIRTLLLQYPEQYHGRQQRPRDEHD